MRPDDHPCPSAGPSTGHPGFVDVQRARAPAMHHMGHGAKRSRTSSMWRPDGECTCMQERVSFVICGPRQVFHVEARCARDVRCRTPQGFILHSLGSRVRRILQAVDFLGCGLRRSQ